MNKQFFNDAFKGYEVPENIKNISIAICNRFAIAGICDPMYISNEIATESSIGNGGGHFTSNIIINHKQIAERLQGCYGCNILKNEIEELEFCLLNGYFEKEKAITGLNLFIKRIKQELKTCDEWRIDYLNRVLNNIQEVLYSYE